MDLERMVIKFKNRAYYKIHVLYLLVMRTFSKFSRDQGLIIANGLAFKTVFAFIPIAGVFLGIFTMFPAFSEYKNRIVELIVNNFVPSTLNDAIAGELLVWINNLFDGGGTRKITIVGTIALIYLSLDLFITLDNQVNRTWASRLRRNFIQKVLIYWALLSATPIVLIGYFFFSGLVQSFFIPIVNFVFIDKIHYSVVTFLLLEVFFFILYYVIPNTRVNAVKAIIVSSLVSISWVILRGVFTYYTSVAVANWELYGSFAWVIFLLIWIYINWIILLIGLEFLEVWQEKLYKSDLRFQNFFLFDVGFFLLILNEFNKDFHGNGNGLSIDYLSSLFKYDPHDLKEMIVIFEVAGFIVGDSNPDRHYYLRRSCSTILLKDIESLIWNRLSKISYTSSIELEKICELLGKEYFHIKKTDNTGIDTIFSKVEQLQ